MRRASPTCRAGPFLAALFQPFIVFGLPKMCVADHQAESRGRKRHALAAEFFVEVRMTRVHFGPANSGKVLVAQFACPEYLAVVALEAPVLVKRHRWRKARDQRSAVSTAQWTGKPAKLRQKDRDARLAAQPTTTLPRSGRLDNAAPCGPPPAMDLCPQVAPLQFSDTTYRKHIRFL
jgi:hypothetical protein